MGDERLPGKATTTERPAKGARTRESILRVAVDLASVEGLEGLTIGRLAEELAMSKSGLFAHFGSKEDLQLATVAAARVIFTDRVIRPALAAPQGVPRLWQLCEKWLQYVEGKVFRGGCFFAAASFEFDSRSGPVRDAIAEAMREWLGILARAVEGAKKVGHLKASVNAEQFAFEIYSLAIGAHWGFQLLEDKKALARVRATIRERIQAQATPGCPRIRISR
ncbi:MAG: TetR/AcrR family transcriptional regulator [Actinomycetota bacterium]